MEEADAFGVLSDIEDRIHHHHEDDGNPLGGIDPVEPLILT
jgi:hypothetical protein